MTKLNALKYVAIDPKTGLIIRSASAKEITEYTKHNASLGAFRTKIVVGSVLIDEDYGPGVWYGGAGF